MPRIPIDWLAEHDLHLQTMYRKTVKFQTDRGQEPMSYERFCEWVYRYADRRVRR